MHNFAEKILCTMQFAQSVLNVHDCLLLCGLSCSFRVSSALRPGGNPLFLTADRLFSILLVRSFSAYSGSLSSSHVSLLFSFCAMPSSCGLRAFRPVSAVPDPAGFPFRPFFASFSTEGLHPSFSLTGFVRRPRGCLVRARQRGTGSFGFFCH